MDGGGEVQVTDSMRRTDTARHLKLTVDRTTALGVDRDLCLQDSRIKAAHRGLCGWQQHLEHRFSTCGVATPLESDVWLPAYQILTLQFRTVANLQL